MSSYRKDGKSKKTIRSLGYVDELEKEFVDPIAHFQAYCDEQNEAAKAQRQAVPIEIHPKGKPDKRTANRKNIGSAVLLSIYNSLGIERTIRNSTREGKATFGLNAVLRLLLCERILNPGSKLAVWNNKDGYFFRSEFKEQHVYRALSALEPLKEKIVSAINRAVDRQGIRDMTSVCYDVTNCYFECDPDELRCKGVSKEHRPNPIVQMGLLQDKNAIPIGYRLFPGNTNDCNTMIMMDVLSDMKRDYRVDHVIVVAGKGLNTSDNIAACIGKGDGFVYSQSVRGTKSTNELRNWVISDEGDRGQGDDFKIKSRQDAKTIAVADTKDKKRKVSIETKTVAFWLCKYAERARYERETTIKRARELICNPGAYSSATHYGAAKYVEGLRVDEETGEILQGATALAFDEAKLAADEACDGCYCPTPEHIEVHFLTCYVALCVLRLLQIKTGNRYSAASIADELSKMYGTNVNGNWWCFDHRSDTSDDICASVGIDLAGKFMQLQDIKKVPTQANNR